jgi:hypothetical protein
MEGFLKGGAGFSVFPHLHHLAQETVIALSRGTVLIQHGFGGTSDGYGGAAVLEAVHVFALLF